MSLHVSTGCRQALRTLWAQQMGLVTNNLGLASRTRADVLKCRQLNPLQGGLRGASGTDSTQGRNLARGHERKKEPTGKARTVQKVGRTKAVRGTVSVLYEMLLTIGRSTGEQTLDQHVEVAKQNKTKKRPVDHFQKHVPRGTSSDALAAEEGEPAVMHWLLRGGGGGGPAVMHWLLGNGKAVPRGLL